MDKSMYDIIDKALRGKTIDDLVNGWSFRVDEVSSNVYKIDGIDKKGNRVSNYGVDAEKVLSACIRDAQRIVSRENFVSEIKTTISKLLRLKK
jgi:hypothetical protein